MKYILLSILFILASCVSPSKTIADNTNNIATAAVSSKDRFVQINEATKTELIDVPFIQEQTTQGQLEQEKIIALTKSTNIALTKVEDQVPWWASLLNTIMITLSILALCFILWYTGLGTFIKGLFYSVGLFIPKQKVEQAEIIRKALNDKNKATTREAIAALRASDPALDAAYRKVRKKEKLQ
jgi:hypothetical protein